MSEMMNKTKKNKNIRIYDSNTSIICVLIFQAKNADYFSHYVTEDFTTYLNRKRLDHCHGNHVEMQAICELFNRPIEVYQYSIGWSCSDTK